MKIKNISLLALLSLGLIACGNDANTTAEEQATVVEESAEEVAEPTTNEGKAKEEVAEEASEEEKDDVADSNEAHYEANIAMLSGPTSAGAINMIEKSKGEDTVFSFTESVEGAPDAVVPKLVSGEADLAIIPANLAATLYNKTEGNISVLATNNLGVLYIVQTGEPTITSIEDLVNSGETIYASGKGATPEVAINQILTTSGFDPAEANIEYLSEASEVAQKLIAGEASVALLPEPMVTNVLMNREDASVVLDVNELYKESTGGPLITAVLVGRDEYLDQIDVDALLEEYKSSIDAALNDVDDTAALLGKYEVMPEPVAKKALPKLALHYEDGEELKEDLSTYLGSLFAADPQLVGGILPEDDFYYSK